MAVEDIKDAKAHNLILREKIEKSEEALMILDSQKGDILLELQARITEIDVLKKELSTM